MVETIEFGNQGIDKEIENSGRKRRALRYSAIARDGV
jgi:hypothetical protein